MALARRMLLIFGLVTAIVVVTAVVVVHHPVVQRSVWTRAVNAFESATGLLLEAGEVRFRLLPAFLELERITVRSDTATVVAADRLELRFDWLELLGRRRSVDLVAVDGLRLDLGSIELPDRPSTDDGGTPLNPWRELEIGELRLRRSRLRAGGEAVGVEVRQLTVDGELRDGTATVQAEAGAVMLERDARQLDLGSIAFAARGTEAGVTVDRLRIQGDAFDLTASGRADLAGPARARAEVEASADVARAMTWWDPRLANRLSPSGRLAVTTSVGYGAETGIDLEMKQRGDAVTVGDLTLARLNVRYEDGVSRGRVDIGNRGWLRVASDDDRNFEISAAVDDLGVEALLELAPPLSADRLPAGLRVSGTLDARIQVPFDPESASADGDIRLRWPDGEVRVDAAGKGSSWRIRKLGFELPGAAGTGTGRIDEGSVAAALEADADDPDRLMDFVGRWIPEVRGLPAGGGACSVRAEASGPLAFPSLRIEGRWRSLKVGGLTLDEVRATADGDLDEIGWAVEVVPASNGLVELRGRTRLPSTATVGDWSAALPSVADLAGVAESFPGGVRGSVEGGGGLSWARDRWTVDGSLSAFGVGVESWQADEASARFEASSEGFSISRLEIRSNGGVARLDGSLAMLAPDTPLRATLTVESLPLPERGLPELAAGTISADARFGGTSSRPTLSAEVAWWPADDTGLVGPLALHLELGDGVVEAVSEEWRTAAGSIHGHATVPLGSLPTPDWFWPEAPGGPIRATVTGVGLRTGPVMKALDTGPLPGEVTADLTVELGWDPTVGGNRMVLAEVENLKIVGEHVNLTSERTVRVRWSEGRIELEPVSLTGLRNHLEVAGAYDTESNRLQGEADLDLSASVVDMLPLPVRASGPIRIEAEVEGPLEALDATVMVDHAGGSIVMREPAVAITDLSLELEVADGKVWIQDGEAGLNRGRLLLGGGWDPESGQGVVLEIDDVKALLGTSIVTSWSGTVAIEPDRDMEHPARVVGELALEAGLWERPFDLKEALFGTKELQAGGSDPVNDIALDLQVSGYGGVRVDNNLGRFEASWGTLDVGGTVGQPQLVGTIKLAPGGTVNLPGETVTIRRATLDFTGNPETDPVMEIVPENFSLNLAGGDDAGSRLDTTRLAAETLARSAGSVLGLENTTLQPAEIAFETQTDASSAFTAGRRLSRSVALFLTTDLSDVQSQTTMLQLWNLRGLPGLAIQGYTRTGEDEQGGNLIQRYRWGGTAASDDRPVIHRIRLDGDWPISKRKLRRATGLRRGEPYEPFLLFAAGLRLETALAERGYPLARVTAEAEGDEALPALVFGVDPGPRQPFEFTGHSLPDHVRRAAVGLYRPPPLELGSLDEMRRLVLRHLWGSGFPHAEVTVERVGDEIVVETRRGKETTLTGPHVEGVPAEASAGLRSRTGTPEVLAELIRDRDGAARLVEEILRVEGYPQAELEDLWLTEDDGGSQSVNLRIDPGSRLRLADVTVSGEDPLGILAEELGDFEAGMPVDRQAIGRAAARVRSAYRSAGYAEVDVTTTYQDVGDGEVAVEVDLEPGSKRTVREIEIEGLRHIRESVIRKGLTIEAGEVLLPAELDSSALRTAYFSPVEKANVEIREAGLHRTDVILEVSEKPRWTVEAGAGWSTERGTNLQFGLRDDGLLGRGAGLNLRGQWDERRLQAALYASLPPLPGGRWSTVANFFWYDGDSTSAPEEFDQRQLGGAVESTYSLSDTASVRGYLRRQRTDTEVKDPEDYPPGLAPDPTTDDETIVGTQLVWDRLDNPFDPGSGSYVAVDLSHNAPWLGSDLEDLRLVVTGSMVLAPATDWTWDQKLRVGWLEAPGGDVSSPNRRFFAGGQATVRGFDLNSIGPVIPGQDGFVAAGGDALLVLNEELKIPIVSNIRAAVFADVGQVWSSWDDVDWTFSVGAGVGLRYATPIGPLWADVAWPVANRNISSGGAKYYFGLGTTF